MAITPYHKPVSGNPVDTYAPINWDFINQSLQQKDVAVKIARAISIVECAGWHDTTAAMQGFDLI